MNKILLFILLLVCSVEAYSYDATIVVRNQWGFDRIDETLRETAKAGKKDILVKIRCGNYLFKEDHLTLKGLPNDVSVTLKGKRVKIFARGVKVEFNSATNYNSIYYYQGRRRFVVENWTQIFQCDQLIEVVDSISKVCRLKLKKNDVATKGDYIQISQWYLTYKYEVVDSKDGYVYFYANNLKHCGGGKSWSVNYDYVYGKEMPRYRIWHTRCMYEDVIEGNVMRFANVKNVILKKLAIEGITFCGNAYISSGALIQVCGLKADEISITNCEFKSCHSTCISFFNTINAKVSHCKFLGNLTTCIYSDGNCINSQVTDCFFENNSCGWNNSFCINIKGKNFIVASNELRDFGYGAIGIGEHHNATKVYVTGIIENNEIYYTPKFYNNYRRHTLMDSGAIYLWTLNDNVNIHNNFIHDYIGIKDNRGIFCDDGASNITITNNTILRIANCYCIDSRRIKDQHPEKYTNNVNITITNNIIDGRIRFEGRDEAGNRCVYGRNTVRSMAGGIVPEMKISSVEVLEKDAINVQ